MGCPPWRIVLSITFCHLALAQSEQGRLKFFSRTSIGHHVLPADWFCQSKALFLVCCQLGSQTIVAHAFYLTKPMLWFIKWKYHFKSARAGEQKWSSSTGSQASLETVKYWVTWQMQLSVKYNAREWEEQCILNFTDSSNSRFTITFSPCFFWGSWCWYSPPPEHWHQKHLKKEKENVGR